MSFRNQSTGEYPVSHQMIRNANPQTSYPAYFEQAEGYDWVVMPTEMPQYNPQTQYLQEQSPVQVDGVWTKNWVVLDHDEGYIQSQLDQIYSNLENEIKQKIQQRLDQFAQTRGYDNVISAVSYSDSTNSKYRTEAQYMLQKRDETWGKSEEILQAVVSNQRPVPSGYEDIEAELPALQWPNA